MFAHVQAVVTDVTEIALPPDKFAASEFAALVIPPESDDAARLEAAYIAGA